MTGSGSAPLTGRVDSFDEARGVGTVVDDAGRAFAFHCTALTDGTRTVAVGTRVVFAVAATHLGRVEARAISTIAG